MLADLPAGCDVGSKTNSKGFKETWIGYKLHIDIACGQVAIPMMTMTSARVRYLYELMDAAYDAGAIARQSQAFGHIPLINENFLHQSEVKAECAEEVARMKFIRLPDPDDALYDFRTMAERVNTRLKDEFGGRFVCVRGTIKVKRHLMFGVLALAFDQLFRVARFAPPPA